MVEKMEWKNLKNGKCPKCGYPLKDKDSNIVECSNSGLCDFFIRSFRLKELLVKKDFPPREDFDSNLSKLNNL